MTADKVIKLVLEYLDKHSKEFESVKFDVIKPRVYEDDSHLWHIPIRPKKSIEGRGRYYDTLNVIERDIEVNKHLNVMLVPVKPE